MNELKQFHVVLSEFQQQRAEFTSHRLFIEGKQTLANKVKGLV